MVPVPEPLRPVRLPGNTREPLTAADVFHADLMESPANFPVAHTAGDTTHVPGADPSEASTPLYQ